MIVSDRIAEKALRLVEENRVVSHNPTAAIVVGDTEAYPVLAQNDRVWCPCPAWKPDRYCSHAVAAMIVWAEAA